MRPLDIHDLPDPARCPCGAVEPKPGDFEPCIDDCGRVICPTCVRESCRCQACWAKRSEDYEPAEDTGHESEGQRAIRELTQSGGRMR